MGQIEFESKRPEISYCKTYLTWETYLSNSPSYCNPNFYFVNRIVALIKAQWTQFARAFVDKNADRDQNCSLDLIYFQHSRVYTQWFSHMCLLLLLAYMRNLQIFIGQSVAFMTGYLFTFLVVLSLICSVTMQILICENQTNEGLKFD